MKRKHPALVITPGPVDRVLSESEVEAFVQRWLATFGTDSANIHVDEYLWHVFSYTRFPSASRADALAQYEQQIAAEFVIISNDGDQGLVTKTRPAHCSLHDWLVFPPNLAWTMAFTHEDGRLGPYFAKSTQYEPLDAENRKALRQASEAERARRKGWA